jgi:hypothetical protein
MASRSTRIKARCLAQWGPKTMMASLSLLDQIFYACDLAAKAALVGLICTGNQGVLPK